MTSLLRKVLIPVFLPLIESRPSPAHVWESVQVRSESILWELICFSLILSFLPNVENLRNQGVLNLVCAAPLTPCPTLSEILNNGAIVWIPRKKIVRCIK